MPKALPLKNSDYKWKIGKIFQYYRNIFLKACENAIGHGKERTFLGWAL